MDIPPVRLLDKVRQSIRLKGYSIRTEKSYVSWIKRYILFHNKQHSEGDSKSRKIVRNCQACRLPYDASQFRHPFT